MRDRLGSNADSSVSHRSELNNKRCVLLSPFLSSLWWPSCMATSLFRLFAIYVFWTFNMHSPVSSNSYYNVMMGVGWKPTGCMCNLPIKTFQYALISFGCLWSISCMDKWKNFYIFISGVTELDKVLGFFWCIGFLSVVFSTIFLHKGLWL